MTCCPETVLELARRHVREGAERIARQEAIVAELDGFDHPVAGLAREVLEALQDSFELMLDHLEAIEKRSKVSPVVPAIPKSPPRPPG
jgi:hypothetical protein